MKKTFTAEAYESLYDREAGEAEYAELVRDPRVKVYRARETSAGDILDVNIGAVWNARGEARRAKEAKRAQSAAAIAKRNDRETERRIEGLLNENFGTNDLALVLTFREAGIDPKKAVDRYLRKLRRDMEKEGRELRYLYMIETVDREGEPLRSHVHIFLNKEAGRERAESIWRRWYGIANATRLEADENGLSGFAAYIQKAPRTVRRQRRWACSRNLRKPKVRRSTRLPGGKLLTKKFLLELINGKRDIRGELEQRFTGYRVLRTEVRRSEYASGVWIDVRMTRYGVTAQSE